MPFPKRHTLGDFLTDDQMMECFSLRDAQQICDQVITPNIAEINRKLGGDNDPMYLAYVVELAKILGG